MTTIHTEGFRVRVEPNVVVLEAFDRASGFTACTVMTPDQAQKMAAEIIVASDRAAMPFVIDGVSA